MEDVVCRVSCNSSLVAKVRSRLSAEIRVMLRSECGVLARVLEALCSQNPWDDLPYEERRIDVVGSMVQSNNALCVMYLISCLDRTVNLVL